MESDYQFGHIYGCNPSDTDYYHDDCSAYGVSGPCCTYTPRVQVKDNWGWCTGRCDRNGDGDNIDPGDVGCYDARENIPPGDNECDVKHPEDEFDPFNPWIPFSGQIIVTP